MIYTLDGILLYLVHSTNMNKLSTRAVRYGIPWFTTLTISCDKSLIKKWAKNTKKNLR